ncbi:helix-turn-helix transcriptional regulator [Paenibacillus sp. IB182496]|uniref:Helix-turn-helix transcriptional regulator n=1 Tax=Paenibacillus sabuli TaxID=2772509 RepID=A0A927GSG7_9BACL|nr:AraC family transcriptional regulator [Paenibacillus sabuli]MBD2846543.1 helix-turn-helix transcriptional regulator [Paenibacillus sabuli]
MFNEVTVNLDKMIPDWHTAAERIRWHIVVLMIEGQAHYVINNEEVILSPGQILFIPLHSERSGKNVAGQPHHKYTVLFNLSAPFKDEPDYLSRKTYFVLRVNNFEYYKHRIEKMFAELREEQPLRYFICKGILQELLGLLGKEMRESTIAPMKLSYVKAMKDYLIDHYREAIEIDDLARLIHRSPNYTISIFKEVMGQSPIQYIHYLRIMEACNLLTDTDMTVSSISEHLGYYDPSYFSKTFKKFMSTSPKAFIIQSST